MKKFRLLFAVGLLALVMSSCTSYQHTIREPNSHVEFVASDFEFSEPFTAEASVTYIFWIDWERTFGTKKTGFVGGSLDLPIIGNIIYGGANIALYKLLKEHPGYDVIFYPQVEVQKRAPIFGSSIYSHTTYKVTARLGRIKNK